MLKKKCGNSIYQGGPYKMANIQPFLIQKATISYSQPNISIQRYKAQLELRAWRGQTA